MKREFLVNLIFLFAINLVIKPLYIFGIDRSVQNTVGDVYGIYFALLSFTYLFQMINDMGLQNFTARQLSIYPDQLDRYFGATLRLKVLLALIFGLLVMSTAWLLGYNAYYKELLLWLILIQIFTSGILYLRANLAGLGFYRLDSFLSVFDKLLMILIVGTLFLLPEFKAAFRIEWFLYAQIASLSASLGLAWYFLQKKKKIVWIKVGLQDLWRIVRESYPFAIIYILMVIYSRIDAVMLERMIGEGIRESYIYASAYRLLDAANMFSYLFIGLLLPMFSRLVGQRESLASLFDVGLRLIVIAAVCLALPVLFYHQVIMEWLYHYGDNYAGELLFILMTGYVFMSVAHIFGALLLAKGTIRPLNWLFFAGILINISLNIWLIPDLKAKGAAISTLITEVYVMVSMAVVVHRAFPGIWNPRTLLKLILYIPVCALGIFTLMKILPTQNAIGLALAVALCAGLALVLRVIPIKSTLAVLTANKEFHKQQTEKGDS
jgi:O-antigen/teichoic acid export membrane protein